jgi:hypothetical protein
MMRLHDSALTLVVMSDLSKEVPDPLGALVFCGDFLCDPDEAQAPSG